MNRKFAIGIALAVTLNPWSAARVRASAAPCNQSLTARIPARAPAALTGSQIAPKLTGIGDDERETLIREQLLAGNIPAFLRQLQPVVVRGGQGEGGNTEITVCVMPDYLALGSDDDFLLIPMRLDTALVVAQSYGFTLPTTKLVDAIYEQAAIHLNPQPLPASDAMRTTAYYEQHNDLIRGQRTLLNAASGLLTSGDKKDLVLTNRLWQNLQRVAIYGWHRQDGKPIQPLSTVHGWHYADYSHGVRFVSTEILVDSRRRTLFSALEDPLLSRMLSSEGAIRAVIELVDRLRQPHSGALAGLFPDTGATGAAD